MSFIKINGEILNIDNITSFDTATSFKTPNEHIIRIFMNDPRKDTYKFYYETREVRDAKYNELIELLDVTKEIDLWDVV